MKAGGTLHTRAGLLAIESVDVVDPVRDHARRRAPRRLPRRGRRARGAARRGGDLPDRVPRRRARPADRAARGRRAERRRPRGDRARGSRGSTPPAATGRGPRRRCARSRRRPACAPPTSPRRSGREQLPFKADVRKLKALGLTESLERGYRLSPPTAGRGTNFNGSVEGVARNRRSTLHADRFDGSCGVDVDMRRQRRTSALNRDPCGVDRRSVHLLNAAVEVRRARRRAARPSARASSSPGRAPRAARGRRRARAAAPRPPRPRRAARRRSGRARAAPRARRAQLAQPGVDERARREREPDLHLGAPLVVERQHLLQQPRRELARRAVAADRADALASTRCTTSSIANASSSDCVPK